MQFAQYIVASAIILYYYYFYYFFSPRGNTLAQAAIFSPKDQCNSFLTSVLPLLFCYNPFSIQPGIPFKNRTSVPSRCSQIKPTARVHDLLLSVSLSRRAPVSFLSLRLTELFLSLQAFAFAVLQPGILFLKLLACLVHLYCTGIQFNCHLRVTFLAHSLQNGLPVSLIQFIFFMALMIACNYLTGVIVYLLLVPPTRT